MTPDLATDSTHSPYNAPEVRTLTPAEWDAWYRAAEVAFGGSEEPVEARQLWRDLTETGRSQGVWEGTTPVAASSAYSFRMAVPGGAVVPVAGVTLVAVLPTHRRRGLLTAMMRRQLDEIRARGEALAVLTASEPAIYGRFGYGLGTLHLALEIESHRVTLPPLPADGVRLRLADPVLSSPACEELYASLVPLRPGMLERRPNWDRLPLLDPPATRGNASPLQAVLAEDARSGRLLGYARYQVRPEPVSQPAAGTVLVRDIEALTPQVYARLWSYLLEIDLTDRVTAGNRPVDDPLLHLVSDTRRLHPVLEDTLYVRLVEVGEALRLREYATPVELVLDVTDEFCPWNTGRWKLQADGPGKAASCVPTAEPADLALSVRELGSAYLGGLRLAALGAAGRVTELREGAVEEASRAFASQVAPWLPHGF
ncbi:MULTISPECIES: GNAT family N-acetyltransferase [Kitasatospora]|uniref:GNAT family N-acetyltransferase n=1 Tax=Kitasatospora cystarginea TaxID=58350 RepID=A0ABN3EFE3_9ACTN